MSPADRIRQMLQVRLGRIGVAPDLRNDGPAVRAVAAEMNVDLEMVVNQLVAMRTEQNMNMAVRMGQGHLSPGALTLLAASKDSLLGHDDFDHAFEMRSHQGVGELASSLTRTMPRERAVAA